MTAGLIRKLVWNMDIDNMEVLHDPYPPIHTHSTPLEMFNFLFIVLAFTIFSVFDAS